MIQPNKNEANDIYINWDDFISNMNGQYFKYNINIVDPITGLNVAKSTFKIDEIKNSFKEGLDIIYGNLYKIQDNNIIISNNNSNNLNINNNSIGYDYLKNKKILQHFFFDK